MDDQQRTPGRRQPCCISMGWAVRTRYIKRGFLWSNEDGPYWIPWSLYLSGPGWIETSPIHYCPFCGQNLDKLEE
jgi:hypothetical protein